MYNDSPYRTSDVPYVFVMFTYCRDLFCDVRRNTRSQKLRIQTVGVRHTILVCAYNRIVFELKIITLINFITSLDIIKFPSVENKYDKSYAGTTPLLSVQYTFNAKNELNLPRIPTTNYS